MEGTDAFLSFTNHRARTLLCLTLFAVFLCVRHGQGVNLGLRDAVSLEEVLCERIFMHQLVRMIINRRCRNLDVCLGSSTYVVKICLDSSIVALVDGPVHSKVALGVSSLSGRQCNDMMFDEDGGATLIMLCIKTEHNFRVKRVGALM